MSNFEKWTKTFVKNVNLLHNEKLTSCDFLKTFYFVSIFFYYLIKNSLKLFSI